MQGWDAKPPAPEPRPARRFKDLAEMLAWARDPSNAQGVIELAQKLLVEDGYPQQQLSHGIAVQIVEKRAEVKEAEAQEAEAAAEPGTPTLTPAKAVAMQPWGSPPKPAPTETPPRSLGRPRFASMPSRP